MENQEKRFREEEELIAALQAGDPDAWVEFVDRYGARFHHYLSYNLPTHEDVEDVWNEIVFATMAAIKEFPRNVRLTTWLYAIAYRKVADHWRRRRLLEPLANENELYAKFREQVRDLPEQAQHALVLRYHAGLSISEIAEVLGRSVKATESLLSRVRQQLGAAYDAELVALTDDRYKDYDSARDGQPMGNSAYGLLLLQKTHCEQIGMDDEAKIFDRACQQLVTLFSIGADAPHARGNKMFRLHSSIEKPSF